MRLRRTLKRAAALALALGGLAAVPAAAAAQPVLVVTSPAGGFGRYYPEILRAEGLNAFSVADTGSLTAGGLAPYDVVVLSEAAVSPAQAAALSDWVQAGGNLIAMRPDPDLAGLLGLGANAGGPLSNAYLGVNTNSAAGAGITSATMQFHGTADRWSLAGASPVATLYSSASASTGQPAVTLRSVGAAGGQAAAFTYDLARSVVYTRQGNPAWANDERDHALDSLRRSDDLFFGNDPDDPQADWVDLNKVAIPQADEQQRLLANLITEMNLDRTPLPRFWYLPRGEKAAFVMTGDDHGSGGTTGQFDGFKALGPPGCSVADWECIRATSYVFPSTSLDNAEKTYENAGFEIGLHTNTGCTNSSLDELGSKFTGQLGSFADAFPTLNHPRSNRNHCIAWDGWADTAKAEAENGIRLDANYYYWPGSWVQNRPGMFTGSGFPMRFADLDGSLIDVYQATTQMTDESEIDIGAHAQALADGALGPEGYYGVFTANMHTDASSHAGAQAIIAVARGAGVPVISAAQLLDWTDGRNASQFQGLSYANGRLSFEIAPGAGARGLEAMLPASAANGALNSLTRNGQPVARETRTVKGIQYHVFAAAAGSYVATYGVPGPTPPDDTDPTPGTGDGGGTGAGPGGSAGGGTGSTGTGTVGAGTGTGGGGTTGTGTTAARAARVRSRTVRASRSGTVKLRIKCPPGESACTVTLRVRKDGRQIVGRRIVTIKPGATGTVTFRLTRSARARLARTRSLIVDATASTRSGTASPATTRNTIRLLAPRR